MSDLVSQNLNMIFKTPKGETVHALKDLNFTLKKGELLTVLGPSGCGKTTLLNITAGFIRPTSGSITLNNKEIEDIIISFCETIEKGLKQGRKIELRGFGTFFTKKIKEKYNARNPNTKELIYVPAKNKVRFRPSRKLKSFINE